MLQTRDLAQPAASRGPSLPASFAGALWVSLLCQDSPHGRRSGWDGFNRLSQCMRLPRQPDAGAATPVRPSWTAGPAGWLTLMTTRQLVGLMAQLPHGESGNHSGHWDDSYEVCQLIRHEIWQREWSID